MTGGIVLLFSLFCRYCCSRTPVFSQASIYPWAPVDHHNTSLASAFINMVDVQLFPELVDGDNDDDRFGHVRPEDLSEDPKAAADSFHESLVSENKRKAESLDVSMNEVANSEWEKLFQHSQQAIATSSTAALLYPWQVLRRRFSAMLPISSLLNLKFLDCLNRRRLLLQPPLTLTQI